MAHPKAPMEATKMDLKLVLLACALVTIGQMASVVYLPSMPSITADNRKHTQQ